jgi:hypothetical protein
MALARTTAAELMLVAVHSDSVVLPPLGIDWSSLRKRSTRPWARRAPRTPLTRGPTNLRPTSRFLALGGGLFGARVVTCWFLV